MYANIYNKMIERDECALQSSEHKILKQDIGGGNSIQPKKGFYKNEPIDELNVKGMYPAIAIEHNISFETVNCRYCKENIIKKEKQLNAKEKILEAFREGTKLSWTKLALTLDEDRVF